MVASCPQISGARKFDGKDRKDSHPDGLSCITAGAYYTGCMKTITIRLPEALLAEIEAESRARKITKSHVVRERLQAAAEPSGRIGAIADLVGSVDGLPADLSARRKRYLEATGYGQSPAR